MTTPQMQTVTTSIDPATQVGLVTLTVANLERTVDFYKRSLGFALLDRNDSTAVLGVDDGPLLVLTGHPGASSPPDSATGLYHFAVLLPSRPDLGRWLKHLLDMGHPIPGQGDHSVSEALYLSDPEGNGIEVYRDRPRSEWPRVDGQVRMGTGPVDIDGLLTEARSHHETWSGLPAGTRIGHIHLKVGDIEQADDFYHGVLGFDVMAKMPSALFVSAGGYHHHVGLNTWHSLGGSPPPEGSTGLRFFTLELQNERTRDAVISRLERAGIEHENAANAVAVQDAWKNTILLHIGGISGAAAAAVLLSS